MAIYRQALDAEVPACCRHGAITIGNFDGVHLGHQALVRETINQARALNGPAVAVTFDPHPQFLLRPAGFEPPLTTLQDRAELLLGYGIDHVVILVITADFLQRSAEEFFQQLVQRSLEAKAIVEGFNFAFGRGRAGTTAVLQAMGQQAGIEVTLLPALQMENLPVSTSRIRKEISAGRVAAARQLLARPYQLSGTVGIGQRRGQSLGFPTANLRHCPTVVPGTGVYAVRAAIADEPSLTWPAGANIGPNPTFAEEAHKIEVHLIGFHGDLYNRRLRVDFLERIRDTRAFSGPVELKLQLERDIAQAEMILAAKNA
jgi:riboflavin kinase/FMN adenylyltransferase